MATPARSSLKLEYLVDEGSIHHVRLMVHSFVLLSTRSRAVAGRLTVTCAELVEDAARRTTGGQCLLELDLDKNGTGTVQVSGELTDMGHMTLVQAVHEVNRGEPLEAFSRALSNAAQGPGTGLSLARIRYEGQMSIVTKRLGSRTAIIATGRQAGSPA